MRSSILFGALLGASACLSSESNTGIDEGATVIDPSGEDEPGRLRFEVPAGPLESTEFRLNGTAAMVPLQQTLDDVPIGSQSFLLATNGPAFFLQSEGRASIAAGRLTVVKTGLLSVVTAPVARTLGLGTDVTEWGMPLTPKRGNVGYVRAASDGVRALPVLEGDYEINFGVGAIDGIPVQIGAGDVKAVTLSDKNGRRIGRIKAPPARDLPTATCGSSGDPSVYRITAPTDASPDPSFGVTLGLGEEIDLGVSPRHEGSRYFMSVIGWADRVEIPLGIRSGGPRYWNLGRIDIKDVALNGGARTVTGTYRIYAVDETGRRTRTPFLACDPPTNTGVDVPPGKYRVEVSYETVETGVKVSVYVVDIPP